MLYSVFDQCWSLQGTFLYLSDLQYSMSFVIGKTITVTVFSTHMSGNSTAGNCFLFFKMVGVFFETSV